MVLDAGNMATLQQIEDSSLKNELTCGATVEMSYRILHDYNATELRINIS